MDRRPTLLMTDPAHFGVSYCINPWMKPGEWLLDEAGHRRSARQAWDGLREALAQAGARTEVVPGAAGWPDMVFPANAAVVLDGRALLARFKCAERKGEEAHFRTAFQDLASRGLLDEVIELPEGMLHEGAGDGIWDLSRRLLWAGWGQRSDRSAADVIARTFGCEVVALELTSPRFYHLDTCFCPLSGGEVMVYPPAFSETALRRIRERVAADQLIEAEDEDAQAFCVNAVNIGHTIVMAEAPPRLRARLQERGYRVLEVDLAPFILSGGAAFCMTLRLDHTTRAPALALGARA